MNKFLNRKKPEAAVASTPLVTDLTRSITPSQLSPGLKKSHSKWRKGKRTPEPKIEIDLNAVLPSVDDFRTSLIMPNLSARFSMLREQDDPNSLLGKAMDDSVLQPRRRSRMLDFGAYTRGGLGDIAEVSSIRSSIRPPFAERGRGDSFLCEDGYESDPNSSSVMSRARPGEGNVMFGGRQRVYMIPKSGSARNLGKVVYEDDIRTSAFQKHKQREREAAAARMADEARQFDFGLPQDDNDHDNDDAHAAQPDDAQHDLAHSPSMSMYDKKRSTNSSTARSEARSSTAATSVASQPLVSSAPPTGTMQSRPSLERSNTKGRRLYEPGLDQHIHEQQNSALTRLNSIQRSRNPSTGARAASPYLHQTKSAGNLQEHPSQRSVYAVGSHSPPLGRRQPAPLQSLDSYTTRDPHDSPTSSPLSPQNLPFDDLTVLSQALEPGDRGKATAMGAFNKPKQPFDEKQYQERQMQLQRSASSATMKAEPTPPTAFQQRIGRFEEKGNDDTDRTRARSKSKGSDARHPAYQGSAARNPNRNVTPSQLAQFSPQIGSQYSDAHRTFFGNIAASDSEDEEDEKTRTDSPAGQTDQSSTYGKWQPTALPSVLEHPALRSQRSNIPLVEEEEEDNIDRSEPPRAVESYDTQKYLGDNLSGMISHLRQRSNASSMYPGEDQPLAEDVPELPANARNLHAYGANNPHLRGPFDSDLRVESTHSGSNPWDLEDAANDQTFSRTHIPVSPLEPENVVYGSRVPNRTAAERDHQGQSQISQVSGVSQESSASSWNIEVRKQNHQRDTSTATQQERAAFDNELAARRAAIQDNIKSIVETERSQSPQIGSSGPFKALNMLRTKSSRDSVDPKRDTIKSLRTAASSAAPSPTTASTERPGYSFESARPGAEHGSRPPMPSNAPLVRALHSEQDFTKREWTESRPRDGDRKRQSPASSDASHDGRSRSNSLATTGRSRSRTGPYRDDLEKAMMEGAGSSAAGLPDLTSFIPKELTPRPSPDINSSHFESANLTRSVSRNDYFDARQYQPSSRNPSGPAVPQTLTSAVYTPSGASARSSPALSPFIQQTATPPVSGASTPLNSSFTTSSTSSSRPLRKKTISKSDISEPTLLSWTSNIDTVDLPSGVSLKNGMTEPPPVPPINPKRKTRKIFGKVERGNSIEEYNETRGGRAKTPDPWAAFDAAMAGAPESTRHPAYTMPVRGYDGSPALNQYTFPTNGVGSPERIKRQAATGATYHGEMF